MDLLAHLVDLDSKLIQLTPNACQLDLIVLEIQSLLGIPANLVVLDSLLIQLTPNACQLNLIVLGIQSLVETPASHVDQINKQINRTLFA